MQLITTFAVVAAAASLASAGSIPVSDGPQQHDLVNSCVSVPHSCTFYSCFDSNVLSCGSDGYTLGYGGHFCQKFADAIDTFSDPHGQEWIWAVMTCLQTQPFWSLPQNTCTSIHDQAFASHKGCYLAPTPGVSGICDLPVTDWISLVKIVGLPTIIEWSTFQLEVGVGINCLEQIIEKVAAQL